MEHLATILPTIGREDLTVWIGSQGRLFSHTHPSPIERSARVRLSRRDLQVPGSSLQAEAGSSCVHPRGFRSYFLSSVKRSPAVCLPRRLAPFSELRSPFTGSLTTSSADRAGPRLSGKLGEIRAVSHLCPGVLGQGFGLSESIGPSQSGQDSDLRRAHRVLAKRWLQWLGYLASLVDVFTDCLLLMRPFLDTVHVHHQPNKPL